MSLFECLSLGVCVFLCELVCLFVNFTCSVFESVCVRVCLSVLMPRCVGRQGSIDELSWIESLLGYWVEVMKHIHIKSRVHNIS